MRDKVPADLAATAAIYACVRNAAYTLSAGALGGGWDDEDKDEMARAASVLPKMYLLAWKDGWSSAIADEARRNGINRAGP